MCLVRKAANKLTTVKYLLFQGRRTGHICVGNYQESRDHSSIAHLEILNKQGQPFLMGFLTGCVGVLQALRCGHPYSNRLRGMNFIPETSSSLNGYWDDLSGGYKDSFESQQVIFQDSAHVSRVNILFTTNPKSRRMLTLHRRGRYM